MNIFIYRRNSINVKEKIYNKKTDRLLFTKTPNKIGEFIDILLILIFGLGLTIITILVNKYSILIIICAWITFSFCFVALVSMYEIYIRSFTIHSLIDNKDIVIRNRMLGSEVYSVLKINFYFFKIDRVAFRLKFTKTGGIIQINNDFYTIELKKSKGYFHQICEFEIKSSSDNKTCLIISPILENIFDPPNVLELYASKELDPQLIFLISTQIENHYFRLPGI